MKELNPEPSPTPSTNLNERVERLERIIIELNHPNQEKELLDVSEAAALLHLSISTIYILKCRNRIPWEKPRGRLYFKRSALMKWIESKSTNKSTAVFKKKTLNSKKSK
jgi:excisionase family DNA binding protein